jgi:hypothetical protein
MDAIEHADLTRRRASTPHQAVEFGPVADREPGIGRFDVMQEN